MPLVNLCSTCRNPADQYGCIEDKCAVMEAREFRREAAAEQSTRCTCTEFSGSTACVVHNTNVANARTEALSLERRLQLAVASVLELLEMDLSNPGLAETPRRVSSYLLEFCQPCNLVELLKAFDPEDRQAGTHNMVIQTGMPFAALCEHHLAPFYGEVYIGYIPQKKVVGLSKMTRLAERAGRRRPTMQEQVTDDIANAMEEALGASGVMVVTRAQHTCQTVRGPKAPNAITTTSAVRGVFRDVAAARQEFLSLIQWRG
jgi:GTP cyclohydrolase I